MARLTLRVQPRASRDEIVGRHGATLRLRVTAAPVDGAANAAVTRVLARALDLPPSAITVAHGREGRTKIVEIAGLTPSELERRLALALARAS